MNTTGFFAALFDLSFRNFVTARIVSVLYVISIVLAAIYTLVVIVAGFMSDSPAFGVLVLLVSPIFFLLFVLYARVVLEVFVVLFRIQDNTRTMAETLTAPGGGAGPSTAGGGGPEGPPVTP